MKLLFIFLVLIFCHFSSCAYNPYCYLRCGTSHTVCMRHSCDLDKRDCSKEGQEIPLNYNEQESILQFHNEARQKVARGQETRGGNSQSADMRALSYDFELAEIAQCWANTCPVTNDICRSTKRHQLVGQNIFILGSNDELDMKEILRNAVKSWSDHASNTTKELIDSYDSSLIGTGNYFTQLVWSTTELVGCGRTMSEYAMVLVCNYGPGGNIDGAPTYIRGPECSLCTWCNTDYPGLCGRINRIERKNIGNFGARGTFEVKWFPMCLSLIITTLVNIYFIII